MQARRSPLGVKHQPTGQPARDLHLALQASFVQRCVSAPANVRTEPLVPPEAVRLPADTSLRKQSHDVCVQPQRHTTPLALVDRVDGFTRSATNAMIAPPWAGQLRSSPDVTEARLDR